MQLGPFVLKHKSLLVARVVETCPNSQAGIRENFCKLSLDRGKTNWLFRLIKLIEFNVRQMNHIVVGCQICQRKRGKRQQLKQHDHKSTSSDGTATVEQSTKLGDQETKMTSSDIAIHLRIIEDFTNGSLYQTNSPSVAKAVLEYIWFHLVRNNYFSTLRLLLDSRVPQPYEESLRPPTVLASALMSLLLEPLKQVYSSTATSRFVTYSLLDQLLAPRNTSTNSLFTKSGPLIQSTATTIPSVNLSPQVLLYVLPTLSSKAGQLYNLSPKVLLYSILDSNVIFTTSSGATSSATHDAIGENLNFEYPIHASIKNNQLTIQSLYCLIRLISPQLSHISLEDKYLYLYILGKLSILALVPAFKLANGKDKSDPSSQENYDEDDDLMETDLTNDLTDNQRQWQAILINCATLLNDVDHVNLIISLLEPPLVSNLPHQVLHSIFNLSYSLMTSHTMAIFEYRLLHTLAFKPSFLRQLWSIITSEVTSSVFSSNCTPLLTILSNGLNSLAMSSTTNGQWLNFVHNLTLFCRLMSYLLPTVDDLEFYSNTSHESTHVDNVAIINDVLDITSVNSQVNDFTNNGNIQCNSTCNNVTKLPFTLGELAKIAVAMKDVTIGLIYLAYHDSKNATLIDTETVQDWILLFKSSVAFVRQLYNRNSRRTFVPINLWTSDRVVIPYLLTDRSATSMPSSCIINFELGFRQRAVRYSMFLGLSRLSRSQLEETGPPLSTTEIRNLTILQEVPFVVPFTDRVKILQSLMNHDREISNNRGSIPGHHFLLPGSMIDVRIRRNYIYEDAFEKLLPEGNFKKPIRVQLINDLGLEEAGVDGGGLFREFLYEFLKAAFDPNRGFFLTTNPDQLIHPNPSADTIYGPDHVKHYYFIGRMLGKALYESMLVDLPLAQFFLAKLISRGSSVDIDMHHLATLDPTLYKNLISLKSYEASKVTDLNLDFTVTNSVFGQTVELELKPGGKNIPVTAANRIEYIHLIADYRLNRQTREACKAFKSGFSDVIDLDWIRMFSPNELHILISGNPTPIDVDDLIAHTKYAGGYSDNHPVIQLFWSVVKELNESQRQLLLKFVTSCSRPPLLGFRNLVPPFCIQFAGHEERLPTASTCMNLLKLPEYNEKETLKSKLIYAIESAAGFELS